MRRRDLNVRRIGKTAKVQQIPTVSGKHARSDALVLFGVTGDLAYKMTFPALYAMARRGDLNVPLRWEGVPWYLRSGKYLAQTATEIIVHFKAPPQKLFADSAAPPGDTNYLRFRVSPRSAIALAVRVKRAGKEYVGDQRELFLSDEQPDQQAPYERLLGAAIAGDGALFTREDAVEAAWAIVGPVLDNHRPVHAYQRHSWGPKEADPLISADGGWHNPTPDDRS